MANLTRWDPFGERGLFPHGQSMEEWMNRLFRPRRDIDLAALDIPVDVTESDAAYTVKADMPGVKKEDISVSVDGNVVSISAEVKKEKEVKQGDKVLREERFHGAISRSFSLASDVDQGKAEAQYANGVLTLTLPKKPGTQSRKLEVH